MEKYTLPHAEADRIVYFDYLRVFATFSVMILHVAAQNWYTTEVNSLEWKTFNFYDSIVRWGVPIFVMISGALFLDRDIPVRKIISKHVRRLAVSFLVWSAIYALVADGDVKTRLAMLAYGHYHMWFIPMLAGVYICIPFIKAIIDREERLKFYLFLSFVFAFLLPEITTLANDFAPGTVIKCVKVINKYANIMNMHLVLGYAGYFVLGFYLNKVELSRTQRRIIYILGVIGFAATIYLDLIVSLKAQKGCANYYDAFNVNVLFESVAVFTWFKHRKYTLKLRPLIVKLSKYSYGAYLVHALVIEQLKVRLGLNTLSFHAVFSVLCIGVIVFVCSFVISAVLNRIPVVQKYVV